MGLKVVGGLLIAFGLVDLIGSYTEFDVWTKIGIELPEIVWRFSAYIEIGLGFFLFKIGSRGAPEE